MRIHRSHSWLAANLPSKPPALRNVSAESIGKDVEPTKFSDRMLPAVGGPQASGGKGPSGVEYGDDTTDAPSESIASWDSSFAGDHSSSSSRKHSALPAQRIAPALRPSHPPAPGMRRYSKVPPRILPASSSFSSDSSVSVPTSTITTSRGAAVWEATPRSARARASDGRSKVRTTTETSAASYSPRMLRAIPSELIYTVSVPVPAARPCARRRRRIDGSVIEPVSTEFSLLASVVSLRRFGESADGRSITAWFRTDGVFNPPDDAGAWTR